MCEESAAPSSLRILKWTHGIWLPWNCTTYSNVGASGHLSILLWARRTSRPWDSPPFSKEADRWYLMIVRCAIHTAAPGTKTRVRVLAIKSSETSSGRPCCNAAPIELPALRTDGAGKRISLTHLCQHVQRSPRVHPHSGMDAGQRLRRDR